MLGDWESVLPRNVYLSPFIMNNEFVICNMVQCIIVGDMSTL